jgi:uncharacterized membrane-anchored protein
MTHRLSYIRTAVIVGTLMVFLYLVNTGILGAERTIANGTPVYLELAPIDPRSLIQGDYMVLDYAIENDIRRADMSETPHGAIVARLDDDRVAQFVREYDGGDLAEGEILLKYARTSSWDVRVGVGSFFFQEGLGDQYANAEYADVRVTADGTVMLVDLVGADFEPLVE